MKKYIKWIMLMLVCIVIFGVNQTAICAKNNKVVEVKNDIKCEGTKEWSIISGIDKNGKTVWKYRTKKYEAAQLNATTCGTYKNTVIIFEKGKLRKLNKQTGKVLYKGKKEIIPAGGINFICDKKGNIYATGYFDSDVYKVSPKGKVLWKTNIDETEKFWPYKLKITKGKLKIWYEGEGAAGYLIFNKNNGKILKDVTY